MLNIKDSSKTKTNLWVAIYSGAAVNCMTLNYEREHTGLVRISTTRSWHIFDIDWCISQYLTVLQSVDVALLLEVTGHVPVLQLLISSSEPGHSVPPWDGGGSAQSRVLLCAPPPHVVLQELQLLHGDQLPSSCTSSALVLGLIQYNIDYFIPTIILVTLRRSEIGVFRPETCS